MAFDDLRMNFLPLKIIRKSTFVYLRIDLIWIFSRNDQCKRPIWEVDRMSFHVGNALSKASIFHPRASWAWAVLLWENRVFRVSAGYKSLNAADTFRS